ncbi:MAG TPA: hypothetical protein VKR26_15770, partial [Terriglobales bacterium]|nr:hypothetical protein [Terriglobales bacterium]
YTGPVNVSCSAPWFLNCSIAGFGGYVTNLSGPTTFPATISFPGYTSRLPAAGSYWITFSTTGYLTPYHATAVRVNVMDFAVTAHSSYAAAFAGQTAKYELFVNSIVGTFANPISFSCSGLPQGSTCSFSPASVTLGGSQSIVVLSVSTTKRTAALQPPASPLQAQFLLALLLPGMVVSVSGSWGRKKTFFAVLLVLVLAAVMLQPACGGGGSSAAPPPAPPPTPPTPTPSTPPPPVNYGFTVTATSGTAQHQLQLTLIVQPQ